MNLTRDRLQSIGWAFVLTVCFGLTMALTFRVNAVKSEVRLADRQIVALKREKLSLETEFETRSNQQQLTALNDVEFGYQAPTAEQYIEGERQLALLGKPRAPGAPAPIRVASAGVGERHAAFPVMVSPLTGKSLAEEAASASESAASKSEKLAAVSADELGAFLAHIEVGEAKHE